jgi:hypothetical protein
MRCCSARFASILVQKPSLKALPDNTRLPESEAIAIAKNNFLIPWQIDAGKAAALPYRAVIGRRCCAALSGNLF